MTSTAIDAAFVKHFQAEVVTAYQQMGSKLRSTVRSKNNIVGASTTFQVIGKGMATTKERNGVISAMSVEHKPVECVLNDYYAGAWIDKLDEIKVGHDERRAIAEMGAYALGRKTDELIINALNTSANVVSDTQSILSKDLILEAFTKLNNADVPDDGERYALVSPAQWNQLLNIEEFSSANYVGEKTPFIAGVESRKWLGINWIMHTGLPNGGDDNSHTCFIYHRNAIGHAVGMDIKTDISWHGDRAAHFVNSMMSQGACLIDDKAVVKMICSD